MFNSVNYPPTSQPATIDRLLAWYRLEYAEAPTAAQRAAVCNAAKRDGYTSAEFTVQVKAVSK